MGFVNPNPFTTRPEIDGTFGVVTSTHWIATAVGMGILERGGNAFDAAVATAFTLQVVEPHLNGPGGDVPVIVYDVRRGKPEVICGQGPAPARRDHRALPRRSASISCPAPGCSPPASRHVRHLDDCCCATTARCARRRARARDRLRAQRLSAGRARHAPPSTPSRTCSASTGRPRPRSICRAARCRRPARCSPIRRWPTPTSASCARPRAPAATARQQIERARKTWSQGFVAEAIDRFCRTQEVMDTSRPAPSRRARPRDDMASWQATRRGADRLRLRPLHGAARPGPGRQGW